MALSETLEEMSSIWGSVAEKDYFRFLF